MDRQVQQSGKGMARRLAVLLGSAALLLPLAEPVGQRSGIVARSLLAMAATAVATPAQAQTPVTLVSNVVAAGEDTLDASRAAQAFTTGPNAYGYTLTSITLYGGSWDESSGNTATLHNGSRTGTQVTGFTAMVSGETLVLTPTSTTTLTQQSTYYLVTSNDFGTGIWSTTASDDEDSGAADGWSIADDGELFRTNTMEWVTITTPYFITVKGYANPNITVANEIADQSAVVDTPFSFTFPDDTFSDPDGDPLTYSATLSDGTTALPSWLTFDSATRTFQGTPTTNGATTVRVTASDGTNTVSDDFHIRVSSACPAPSFVNRREIWNATVIVGNNGIGVYGYGDDEVFGSLRINGQILDGSSVDFTIGPTGRTLNEVSVNSSGDLEFAIKSGGAVPSGVQLHVCDMAYDFSDASLTSNNNFHTYLWNLNLDWSSEPERTVYLSLPANRAATGAPSVTGDSTEVGATLTAATSGIMDADGGVPTTPSSFTYQWFRVDADGVSNRRLIPSATSSTYTTTIEDAGKRILVQVVSFTDLFGNLEESPLSSTPYPATGMLQRQMEGSEPVLVQNIDEISVNSFRLPVSQTFTTGSNPRGYTLASVAIDVAETLSDASDFHLRIFTVNAMNEPDEELYTLINPATTQNVGLDTFTAPSGAVLEPDTTYALLILGRTENKPPAELVRTASTSEDPDNGESDWSIGNQYRISQDNGATWTFGPRIVRMSIRGWRGGLLNMDATLSALELTNASDDSPITLSPAFASDEATYTADVTGAVRRITVAPRLNDAAASFDIVDGEGEAIPDADTVKAGRQVDLTTGENVIRVQVSAEDGMTENYTVTVTHPATVCTAPTFTDREQIWTGTVTVGNFPAFDGFSRYVSNVGDLDDTTFDIGGRNTTIDVAFVGKTENNGHLSFSLTSALTEAEMAALKLHVCDTAYDLSAAIHDSQFHTYRWPLNLDWSNEIERRLYLSLPANTPATGAPAITGTPQVGQMLSVGMGDIADADGLSATFPDDYGFQWMSEDQDGTNPQTITGATSSTYMPTAAEEGKRVKVQVSFTDDLGRMEMLTSAAYPASGGVEEAGTPAPMVPDANVPAVVQPGVSVSPTSVNLVEGGADTYTVRLITQPTAAVTITPTSGDSDAVSVSPASLTFTTSNWDTPRTITVTGVDDADTDNEMVTISHGVSGYGSGTTAADVVVSVTDNEAPGVSVSPTSVNLIEGRTDTYTVRLITQPTTAVTITPTSSDSDAVSVSTASLTFTASNWSTPQPVTVMGVEDSNNDNETVTISHGVSGYGSVTTAADVTVRVTDNEAPGVNITPRTLTLSEASRETYTLMLDALPSGPVTITPTSDNTNAVSLSPARLTITPSNWDTPRTITVTGVDDADTDNETVTISHSVSIYGSVTIADDVTVNVMDTDTAGVRVSTMNVDISEGETDTYTLVLDSLPDGPVTITTTHGDSGAVSVSPASVVFTTANWNTAQTMTVTGVADDDTTDETVTISHSVSGYGSVTSAADVTVTVDEVDEVALEAMAVLKETVLPELLQQVTAQTTEVITSRLSTIASGSLGAPLTLGLDDVVADTVAFLYGERGHLKDGSLEWQQAFSGRDFAFPLFSSLNLAQGEGASTQEGPFSSLALWGGADYSSYGNTMETTDVDGKGFSGTIGMDMQPIPRLVTGLALTTSRWELDYTTAVAGDRAEGTYEVGITTVNPYVNWLATEKLSLWATVGYGRGEVEQTPDGEGPATSSDSDSLTSWAGGLRFEVVPGADPLTGEGSPFGLAFKVDGATSSFLDTDVQLARLAAEVSRSFTTVENGLLTAAVDLGWSIRRVSDKDDADGDGAELAGRLNWLNMDGSASAMVDARVLLGGGDRKEWGMGGHFRLTAPSRGDGEGLNLTLQPSFGVTGTRLDELWSLSGDGDLAISNDLPGARLDAQLAYGFPLGDALLTPYTEVVLEDATSIYGAGLRYGLNASLELDLKGVRRSNANGNPEYRLLLDVRTHL